jgi:peptide/nickel transport system ATP-binding protein
MLLLDVRNLRIELPVDTDRRYAVDDVSFSVDRGEVVCLVGESGSGKSMVAHAIVGLTPKAVRVADGSIRLDGMELVGLPESKWRQVRGVHIGMVFQEPMSALNPLMRIGNQVEEVLRYHSDLTPIERKERTLELLAAVGLPTPRELAESYPFRLSGGQRQRVVIAMALALKPKLLIADEPTTALDVTTQAQILLLIRQLQKQYGMGLLFITHDLSVVADIADRVIVMEKGKTVEQGPVDRVLLEPAHPYTRRLVEAMPSLIPPKRKEVASHPLLSVERLTKTYSTKTGFFGGRRTVHAVRDVSFVIERGTTLGLVGESGSGKTTLGRMIAQLVKSDRGSIRIDGTDIAQMNSRALAPFRRRIQIVFQDPFGSLNPRRRVIDLIADGPIAHGAMRAAAHERARELLTAVGLSPDMADRLPHEFSGGQRQRIAIARALALDPELLVADEPVSALDVSVQAQVLDLLQELKQRLSLTMLFITHDIRVASQVCDKIAVMYKGEIVESGLVTEVLTTPRHPYTRALLGAVPGRNRWGPAAALQPDKTLHG